MQIISSTKKVEIDIIAKEGTYQPKYNEIKVKVIGLTDEQNVIINGVERSNYSSITI